MNRSASQARAPGPDVAILLPNLRAGGAERVCLSLAGAFTRQGLTVEMVLRQAVGELLDERPPGVTVYDLAAPKVRNALLPFARYLRVRRPRSVLAAMWPITSVAVAARVLSGVRCRVVTADHNILSRSGPGRPGLPRLAMTTTMRATYPLAEGVVGVSAGVADDIAALSGLPRQRIDVIYNPVTPLPPAGPVDRALIAGWLEGPGPRLVTVGRLKPVKDHETLLRAVALLRQDTDARLLIVGDGPHRARTEALIGELGLAGAVTLAGFQSSPHAYVALADAFVLSSTSEGFGNVIVEAMACGVPVVSTDCPSGPREILEHGRYGRLTPVGDPQALAAAIRETIASRPDPDVLRRRSGTFSIDQAADAYRALLGV